MDYQILFNISATIAGFFGGWTLNNISRGIENLDKDMRAMPQHYLAKDDYRQDLRRIEDMLTKIFDRLENKADK